MTNMDILEIAIVTLSSVITGLVVWYATTILSEKRLEEHLKVNSSEFSGHWEGIHLSRDDSRGGTIVSRHSYDLVVSKNGKIKGTCDELAGNPPYKSDVNGAVRPGEIFLIGTGKTAQEPAYTWLFNLYSLDKIPGFHFTYDFDNRPYASYMILSRKRLDEEEYFTLLERELKKFYIHPIKKSK
jgi:hypothetical protein